MRVTSLKIKNIGKIADSEIKIDKPLILFYGEIKQGKSTILNAVRWACGGEFPHDIIRHGADEASVELEFDGGMIKRSWYRNKDGETTARPVVFIKNGKPVQSPVSEIKRMLNPFLLDQDFLRNKTELERKQYFIDLFAVDTTEIDKEIFNCQREAQELRAKIKGYGNIDMTPVQAADVAAMRNELADIRDAYEHKLEKANDENQKTVAHNGEVDRNTERMAGVAERIAKLEDELKQAKGTQADLTAWLKKYPKRDLADKPAKPDTTKLEADLQAAAETNAKAMAYEANKKRAVERVADQKALDELEAKQRELKAKTRAKLKEISETSGIKGLEFDEQGNFIYEGTTAGMISDSQIMKLSSELSDLYPEGFGLSLLDRAESLGKSIFEFVDRAKAENKTILATIVGERPAKVPPEIGVFVVEEGQVKE